MTFTQEQLDIIHSKGNIKINAVAGSGKTTTLIEYARSRPANSNILYLAFNKSVRIEAAKLFESKGLKNVRVETAHSLAFKYIVRTNLYSVKTAGYKTSEIVELLNIQGNHEKHTEYVIANHINKFITYFCNSRCRKVQELNYLDTISEPKAYQFVETYYNYIEQSTRELLKKMNDGAIEITHDFYLKKFQLSNPVLSFDTILFDEGQDASAAMLDVFLKQVATKVIVGDTHQQIYGWRYAVNSLEQVDFKTYHLSSSFRFGKDIATFAMESLDLKHYLEKCVPVAIEGHGKSKQLKSQAIIARTNLGLLLKAITYIRSIQAGMKIYFEGNINSYTYAEEGASLYDVLNLYNYKHDMIRDALVKSMKNMVELEEYIKKTEDSQLGMMVEIVKEYGNDIYDLIRDIKLKQVENDEKEKADMVFSTVHRCKGMEYDIVYLANDFLTEEQLKKVINEKELTALHKARLIEEINLLYVAITRAKNNLHLPSALMPESLKGSKHIHEIKLISTNKPISPTNYNKEYYDSIEMIANKSKSRKAPIEKRIKEKASNANQSWTPELDKRLKSMWQAGKSVLEIATRLERSAGSISSRMKKLEED